MYDYSPGTISSIPLSGTLLPFNGSGSFCTSSADNQKVLHDSQKSGYLAGYSDTCLSVPAGKVFVFWVIDHAPPNCPSTCVDGPGPTPL